MNFLGLHYKNNLAVFLMTIGMGTNLVVSQASQAAIVDGRTTAPPYTESKNPNYQTVPLLTVGDEVPYLNGT